ncbi:hypothetical protein [Methanosphaera sp. WGK6]|uniref:hypothetical protein n=1 Tax=Methanosphaera sp. WGK6 TaxID=1561964 RepID=UPI00084CD998|nr:hypothetical protein [Methanosphaera sp. WGK6]OED29898.1 hypothetical protein NL43_05665 [Methanosphaera sp. WGK6]
MKSELLVPITLFIIAVALIIGLGVMQNQDDTTNNTEHVVENNTMESNVSITGTRTLNGTDNSYIVTYSNGYVRQYTNGTLSHVFWQNGSTVNESFSLYQADKNTLNRS